MAHTEQERLCVSLTNAEEGSVSTINLRGTPMYKITGPSMRPANIVKEIYFGILYRHYSVGRRTPSRKDTTP